VSAPELRPQPAAAGISLAHCGADILEIAAFRGRVRELLSRARELGIALPPQGRLGTLPGGLTLAVRPERWLLLLPPAEAGASALRCREICGDAGTAIELSSGLDALQLAGPALRDVLKRGCRLDLAREAFPAGAAAASTLAQVGVILAALSAGLLLLTPATTARHLREWLTGTARPFGFQSGADVTVAALSVERDS
jgi:sarcosine oxidase, subunit gamma